MYLPHVDTYPRECNTHNKHRVFNIIIIITYITCARGESHGAGALCDFEPRRGVCARSGRRPVPADRPFWALPPWAQVPTYVLRGSRTAQDEALADWHR